MAGKISLVLNVILAAAVIYLFTQQGSNAETTAEETPVEVAEPIQAENIGDLKMAYVNMDSLLTNYKLSVEMNDEIIEEERKISANIKWKMKEIEKDYQNYEANLAAGILGEITPQDYEAKLMSFQQDAENYQSNQLKKLDQMSIDMNNELLETVNAYLEEVNQEEGYDFIFKDGLGSPLLFKNDALDITDKVISDLNAQYDQENANPEEGE